jgi:hypothetical protein
LHEQISPLRWLGIALISGGVGFVAGGPALTARHEDELPSSEFPPFDGAQGKLLAKDARNGASLSEGVPESPQSNDVAAVCSREQR